MKSDSSLIFARLKQLHSVFRVLLTGTPLNNNLRELFNLLNFLDPDKFRALRELEARFENLNEGLLGELHDLISPYILRRIKRDVLKLPPKVEIIVPIAMTPVQKQVTREILHRNVDTIENIVKKRKKKGKGKAKEVEVVDITEDTPAPNGEPAEKRRKTATPEAGPSGTAGEGATEEAAEQPSDAVAESTNGPDAGAEAMDVNGADNGAVLVEDSQPASPPPVRANGHSAEANSEYSQRKKLRGGFSVKGAAAAAARKRWDKHRREEELATLGRVLLPSPAAVSPEMNAGGSDGPVSETGSEFDSESESESESASSEAPRGHGGFCKPGAAAAAANARWARVREQRAQLAGSGSPSPRLVSSDPESEPSPPPRRRRPPAPAVPAAADAPRPARRGGFNVKGAAARAAHKRWAGVRAAREQRGEADRSSYSPPSIS